MNTTHYQLIHQYLTKIAHDTWYSRHKEEAKRNRAMWYMMHKEQVQRKSKAYKKRVDSGIIHPTHRVNMGGTFISVGFH